MLELQEKNFMDAFRALPEIPANGNNVEFILLTNHVPEREWTEAKRIFHLLVRLMKAKDVAEVSDVPLEDILKCFTWQHVFERYFEGYRAGTYFSSVMDALPEFHTKRNRRVL